jgi:hypothetical protein
MDEVVWDDRTPDGWADLAEQWKPEIGQKGTVLGQELLAACPRCRHPEAIDAYVPKDFIFAELRGSGVLARLFRRGEAAPREAKVFVRCECDVNHSGAPDGDRGCGSNGDVALPTDA